MKPDDPFAAIGGVIGAALILGFLTFVGCLIWQSSYQDAQDQALMASVDDNMQKSINEAKLGVPYSGWDEYEAPPAPLPARWPALSGAIVGVVVALLGNLFIIAAKPAAAQYVPSDWSPSARR